jgi:hypothetical protein
MRIILKQITKYGSEQGHMTGSCETGNEISGPVKLR